MSDRVQWDRVRLNGWGRLICPEVDASAVGCRDQAVAVLREAQLEGIIPHGGGRSYGDVALNSRGRTLLTRSFSNSRTFDPETGMLVCDPGVTFHELLREYLPMGFLAPVTPGTGFVTIGGAVANDVHGKNHDMAGSFGDHVLWLDLLLPEGEIRRVSRDRHPDLFAATIAGAGLTGVILTVCFRMQRVPGNAVALQEARIPDLDHFFAAFEKTRAVASYSVGWIDALAQGRRLGRGILETAEPADTPLDARPPRRLRVPFDFPGYVLNSTGIRLFNEAYYRRVPAAGRQRRIQFDRFLYPLDSLLEWNRIYGRRGFYQFQCVIPDASAHAGIRVLLETIARSGAGSFLAVLKTLGGEGQGYLSFPMRGYTLALDFPNKRGVPELLNRLEQLTLDYGGRIYLAKDSCLSAAGFARMYPKLADFRRVLEAVDPHHRMNSDLARRLQIHAPDRGRHNAAPDEVSAAAAENIAGPGVSIDPGESPDQQGNPVPMNENRHAVNKPPLLGVEAAKELTVEQTAELFCDHLNPGQYHFLKLLGFNKVVIRSAEGMYYTDQDGRKILDFFGGFGSLAPGHNHPRILAARRRFQEEKRHEIAIAFMSQYAAALAKNLAAIAPADLDMVFLGSSGSEAVEAALKLAEQFQGPERARIAYADHSFHGKTRGALSVTDSEFYQSSFKLLDNRVRVPFGDIEALEQLFQQDRSVGILILETVQGGAGIVTAAPGYWQGVRRLCDKYNVLWIADEVQCGVGRTGRFFAFEYADVVPDIVTLAKSLGGGKTAMGAMIARRPVYMKAYGTPQTALIHGPATFGGIGEACITSIETLNLLYDEGLIENCHEQGTYLLERLNALREKYPKLLKEIRGQGLMVGVEFHDFSQTLPLGMKQLVSVLDEKLKGSLCGFVGSLLLREHDILVAFTEYNRNVIRLEPPLIVTRAEVDRFVDAFEALLSSGVAKIITRYARNFLKKD